MQPTWRSSLRRTIVLTSTVVLLMLAFVTSAAAQTTPDVESTPGNSSITVGNSNTDMVVVTGDAADGNPTGSVSFYWCGPTTSPTSCTSSTGTEFDSESLSPNSDGVSSTANSAAFTPSDGTGYYCFAAYYLNDGNSDYSNTSDTSTDGCFEVDLTSSTSTIPTSGMVLGSGGYSNVRLTGVSCPSSASSWCMAVGFASVATNPTLENLTSAVAEEVGPNNATQPVPVPSPGVENNDLQAVSCVNTSFCVAVGETSNEGPSSLSFIELWDGTNWTVMPAPSPGSVTNELLGVSCSSESYCVAVGYSSNYSPADQKILIETWNGVGTDWSIASATAPTGVLEMTGVSCTSATFCEAVGWVYEGAYDYQTVIETWNGMTWTQVPSPSPGPDAEELYAVSCTSSTFCEAVGVYFDSAVDNGAYIPLVETLNGDNPWTVTAVPDAVQVSYLYNVSCTISSDGSNFCLAGSGGMGGGSGTISEIYDGDTNQWVVSGTPNPDAGVFTNTLSGISCTASNSCVGVGWFFLQGGTVNQPEIQSYDGTSWTTAASIVSGDSNTDQVTVTGQDGDGAPTGNVDFFECGPTPTPEPCTSQLNPVGTGSVALSTGSGDTSTATSASFTPTGLGYYCFAGYYEGDDVYGPSSDTGTDECFDVTEDPSSTVSTLTNSSIASDSANSDLATVTGNSNEGVPTGEVQFYECTSTSSPPSCTSQSNAIGGPLTVFPDPNAADTAEVTSPPFAPPSAGSYCIAAYYLGDANYDPSSDVSADGCFDVTGSPVQPATVAATGGSGQSAQVDQTFANVLQATVYNSSDQPVPGVIVRFSAPQDVAATASGTFADNSSSTEEAVTGPDGSATFAETSPFTADDVSGSYIVTPSVTDFSGVTTTSTFTLTNKGADVCQVSEYAGSPQQALVQEEFPTQLQAQVLACNTGAPVPGVTVTFTPEATAPSGAFYDQSTQAYDLSTVTAQTDGQGVATAPAFEANNVPGSYTITATATGASPGTFSLSNLASGAPAAWAWGEYPGNGTPTGTSCDPATTSSATPEPVATLGSATCHGTTINGLPPDTQVDSVAAGSDGADLAITPDGAVYSWGDNTYGELGVGLSTTERSFPAVVHDLNGLDSGLDVTAIAEGGDFSLALAKTSSTTNPSGTEVLAWGYAGEGALGDDSTSGSQSCEGGDYCEPTPQVVDTTVITQLGESVVAIAAEENDGLLLTSAGTVYAWGEASHGELGNGADTGNACAQRSCQDSPTLVSLSPSMGQTIENISGGGDYALAMTNQDTVYAWGDNDFGQMGQATTGYSGTSGLCNGNCDSIPVQVAIPSTEAIGQVAVPMNIAEISAGYNSALALTYVDTNTSMSGPPSYVYSVYGWGDDTTGELGETSGPGIVACSNIEPHSDLCDDTPEVLGNLPATGTISEISAGDGYDMVSVIPVGQTSTADAFSWGSVYNGDLGNGSTTGTACQGNDCDATAQAALIPPITTCGFQAGEVQPQATSCIAAGDGQSAAIAASSTPITTDPCDQSPTGNCYIVPNGGSANTTVQTPTHSDPTLPFEIPSACVGSTNQPAADSDESEALYKWIYSLNAVGYPTDPVEIQFQPGGCYAINGIIYLRGLQDYIFDGNGSTFTQTSVTNYELTDSDASALSTAPAETAPYCGEPYNAGMDTSHTPVETYGAEALDDTLTDNTDGTPANDIMWFVEGGCDLQFENMTIVGAYPTGGYDPTDYQQDSAFQFTGSQRVLVDDNTIENVYGDCVTTSDIHEEMNDGSSSANDEPEYPSSDITIAHNVCENAGRDAIGLVFTNRETIGGSAPAAGSSSNEVSVGNTFRGWGANGIDIEGDCGTPSGGEGNILVENNLYENDGSYLVSGTTTAQTFQFAFDHNTAQYLKYQVQGDASTKPGCDPGVTYPGQNFTVSNNTINQATPSGVKADVIFYNEIGGLISGNTCVGDGKNNDGTNGNPNLCEEPYSNAQPNYVDTVDQASGETSPGEPADDYEVENNTLGGNATGSSETVPLVDEILNNHGTVTAASTGDLECGNTTIYPAPDGAKLDNSCTADPNETFEPLQPEVATLPDFVYAPCSDQAGASCFNSQQRPALSAGTGKRDAQHRVTRTYGKMANAVNSSSYSGDITCSGLSGSVDFSPPLSDTSSSASEMALVHLSVSSCKKLNETALPGMTGSGSMELPIQTSDCSSLVSSDTPTSLGIFWKNASIGASEIVFPSYSFIESGHFAIQLSGSGGGVTVDGTLVTNLRPLTAAKGDCTRGIPVTSATIASGTLATPLQAYVTAPGAPTSVVASPGDGQATVSWTSPTYSGGSAVSSYTVTAEPGGDSCITSSTSCPVVGLTNDSPYTFTVTASNAVGTGLASNPSSAVTPEGAFNWAGPDPLDPNVDFSGISCLSSSFCAAVDLAGNAFIYDGSQWSAGQYIDTAGDLGSVSCVSSSFCMAVDAEGNAFTYNGAGWTSLGDVDGGIAFISVQCQSTTWCMTVDNYGDYNSGYQIWNGSTFSARVSLVGGPFLTMSCASENFCVAPFFYADNSGVTYAITWNGTSWSGPVVIDQGSKVSYISCPTSTFCNAVDFNGNVVTFNGTSWSPPENIGGQLREVSCSAPSFCAAVSAAGFSTGTVFIYDGTSWSPSVGQLDSSGVPGVVSCPSASFCVVADDQGNVFIGSR
jgi:Regulator of chromosome condensation (RCC1) repeat/Fibronectin type III domain